MERKNKLYKDNFYSSVAGETTAFLLQNGRLMWLRCVDCRRILFRPKRRKTNLRGLTTESKRDSTRKSKGLSTFLFSLFPVTHGKQQQLLTHFKNNKSFASTWGKGRDKKKEIRWERRNNLKSQFKTREKEGSSCSLGREGVSFFCWFYRLAGFFLFCFLVDLFIRLDYWTYSSFILLSVTVSWLFVA